MEVKPNGARVPGLESLFVATVVLWGWRLGTRPISDNSAFVHLRTGLDIVADGRIPSTDPYSFTAAGEPWIVQSWGWSWAAGWIERLGGFELVVIEQGLVFALVALLMARLTRTGSARSTALAAVTAVAIGSPFWVPRPLMMGLLCLAVVITVAERDRSVWWVAAPMVVWVNVHGSFPLGVVWLALVTLGAALDGAPWRRHLTRVSMALLAAVVGAAWPVGWRLLAFPATALERREVFSTLVEWRPPQLGRVDTTIAFVALAVAASVLVVAYRRHRKVVVWADLVPVMGFVIAGFAAMRNLPVAAVVLAAPLGRWSGAVAVPVTVSPPQAGPDARQDPTRSLTRVHVVFSSVLVAAAVVFGVAAWRGPGLALDARRHAPEALEWWLATPLAADGGRLAHDEVVGGWFVLRAGPVQRVFIDDRFDMYPVQMSRDLDTLLAAAPGAIDVLDRWDVDAVLWRRSRGLGHQLEAAGWRRVHDDDHFEILVRPGTPDSALG